MLSQITITDAIKFIRANDIKHKAFPIEEWSNDALALELADSVMNNSLAFTLDGDGLLDGICIARRNDFKEIMYVIGAIGNIESLFKMFCHFKLLFPGWKLQGRRNSTLRLYNTAHLESTIRKIIKNKRHELTH